MSFWLLFLSCLPCGDRLECSAKTEATISANKDHKQHQHQGEHCTPFCTCSCCATSAFPQAAPYFSFHKQAFEKKTYPVYNAPFCGEVSFAIWQPPKLS